jgi:hypothetical protein
MDKGKNKGKSKDKDRRGENPIAAEPVKKSRGGIGSYNESKTNTVQQVRGEFLSDTFKPKITIAFDSVTFNMSCVNLFPDDRYIVISIDESDRRLYIEPCDVYNRDHMKFAIFKNGRNNPRKCMARYFCGMLFLMMGWNRTTKYRCLAIFHNFDGKKIIVFNLDDCQQICSEVIETDGGVKKRKTTVNMPVEWKGRFGYTQEELAVKNRLDLSNTLVTIDNRTGEKHYHNIEPKLPTPEEMIHEPYGGIRVKREGADE